MSTAADRTRPIYLSSDAENDIPPGHLRLPLGLSYPADPAGLGGGSGVGAIENHAVQSCEARVRLRDLTGAAIHYLDWLLARVIVPAEEALADSGVWPSARLEPEEGSARSAAALGVAPWAWLHPVMAEEVLTTSGCAAPDPPVSLRGRMAGHGLSLDDALSLRIRPGRLGGRQRRWMRSRVLHNEALLDAYLRAVPERPAVVPRALLVDVLDLGALGHAELPRAAEGLVEAEAMLPELAEAANEDRGCAGEAEVA